MQINSKNQEFLFHIKVVSLLRKLQIAGHDFIHYHCPNGEARSRAVGGRLKLMGVLPGVPDLCLIRNGTMIFIELKSDVGGTSKAQEEFITKAMRHGFETFVISDVDMLISVLCAFLDIEDQTVISSISARVFGGNASPATLPPKNS